MAWRRPVWSGAFAGRCVVRPLRFRLPVGLSQVDICPAVTGGGAVTSVAGASVAGVVAARMMVRRSVCR